MGTTAAQGLPFSWFRTHIYRHLIGLLEPGISLSQCLCLHNTTQIESNEHIHSDLHPSVRTASDRAPLRQDFLTLRSNILISNPFSDTLMDCYIVSTFNWKHKSCHHLAGTAYWSWRCVYVLFVSTFDFPLNGLAPFPLTPPDNSCILSKSHIPTSFPCNMLLSACRSGIIVFL
jgi:hypothetical protein